MGDFVVDFRFVSTSFCRLFNVCVGSVKMLLFLGKCAFIDGSYVNMSFRCNVGKYLFGNGKCATFAK